MTDLQALAKRNAHLPGQMMTNNQGVSEVHLDIGFHQEPGRKFVELL
ncbi:MAG TPA: hypothetical protein VFB12_11195 [Ktedonobacteraceae bacterium]|nr:hypothetical protein [Ktedonobacteraceae bacterium]